MLLAVLRYHILRVTALDYECLEGKDQALFIALALQWLAGTIEGKEE